MILLNLFLAILLENFNIGERRGKETKDKESFFKKFTVWLKTKCS
jgi:hypothetical protein